MSFLHLRLFFLEILLNLLCRLADGANRAGERLAGHPEFLFPVIFFPVFLQVDGFVSGVPRFLRLSAMITCPHVAGF